MRFHGQPLVDQVSKLKKYPRGWVAQSVQAMLQRVRFTNLDVEVKGPGPGRESAVRALQLRQH